MILDMSSSPQEVSSSPQDVSSSPQEVSSSPQELASRILIMGEDGDPEDVEEGVDFTGHRLNVRPFSVWGQTMRINDLSPDIWGR